MKQTNLYIPTEKEVPTQAVAQSHILALKSGLIHQTAAGLYSYLPLATMILQNIERIIDEELTKIGANKIIMPMLQPKELWEQSERWQYYGSELFRLKDRHDRDFALGPTHEEIITSLVKPKIGSYKKYPLNLYQINTKFRDEARPRFGLLRGREFIMMDGYSFHTTQASLNETYDLYYQAYEAIFQRLDLDYRIVKADNGGMGGDKSHEFMVLADIGEDTIAFNDEEAINIELAPVYYEQKHSSLPEQEISEIATPEITKITDLAEQYNLELANIIKAVAYLIDDQLVIAFTTGEREINEIKLQRYYQGEVITEATAKDLADHDIIAGYMGILNLPKTVKVVCDNWLLNITNGVTGANKVGYHLFGVSAARDLTEFDFADISLIQKNEQFRGDSKPVDFAQTIEVGHIFALGDKYTKSFDVKYLTKEQKEAVPLMGCYGIGVSRLLSAIIEQHHDENGIIWPTQVTPFDIHLLVIDYQKNEQQQEFADDLYEQLEELGYRVLLDDRLERPGIKFNEADLIGIPLQIIVGKKYIDGVVEVKKRIENEKNDYPVDFLLKDLRK